MTPAERALRQQRLQSAESTFDALPFDGATAGAYGRVSAQARAAGTKGRGRRMVDLLIAATTLAGDLPIHTQNPADFSDLGGLVTVIAVDTPAGA